MRILPPRARPTTTPQHLEYFDAKDAEQPRATNVRAEKAAVQTVAPVDQVQVGSTDAQGQAMPAPLLADPTAATSTFGNAEWQAAQAFANQLRALQWKQGDDLVAGFLKLQVLDVSGSMTMQALLDEGRHELMKVAFVEYRRLSKMLPSAQSMLAQGNRMEAQAEEMIEDGLRNSQGNGLGGFGNVGPQNAQKKAGDVATRVWGAIYDATGADIIAVANKRGEAQALAAAGDFDGAASLEAEALTLSDAVYASFNDSGYPATRDQLEEVYALAAQNPGQDPIELFFSAHPDLYRQAFGTSPTGKPGFVKEALIAQRSQGAPDEVIKDALLNLDNETANANFPAQPAQTFSFRGNNPPDADQSFRGAYGLLHQGRALQARAKNIFFKWQDAKRTIDSARTASNTHGVMERNAERIAEGLQQLFEMLAGGEGWDGTIDRANAVASLMDWRHQVADLVLDATGSHVDAFQQHQSASVEVS